VRDLCYGTLLWERFGAIFPWPLHVFAALVLKTNKKKCMKNKQTNNINTEKRRGSRKKQTHESFQSVNLWEERARYSTPTHTHMDAKKATWLLFWKLFSWIPDTESHIRGRETIQQRFCQQRAGPKERERACCNGKRTFEIQWSDAAAASASERDSKRLSMPLDYDKLPRWRLNNPCANCRFAGHEPATQQPTYPPNPPPTMEKGFPCIFDRFLTLLLCEILKILCGCLFPSQLILFLLTGFMRGVTLGNLLSTYVYIFSRGLEVDFS